MRSGGWNLFLPFVPIETLKMGGQPVLFKPVFCLKGDNLNHGNPLIVGIKVQTLIIQISPPH